MTGRAINNRESIPAFAIARDSEQPSQAASDGRSFGSRYRFAEGA
jgi:hypothetical protein